MTSNNPRPSKAERTASAREKAAQLQASQAAAQKRKSLFVKLGVLAAVVVVIALVVALIVQNNNGKVADAGAAPKGGNASGGILVTSPTTVANTSGVTIDNTKLTAPAQKPATPTPSNLTVGAKGEPINITLYVDANCVHCADFESTYGAQINDWLAAGKITVEYRNLGNLDASSPTRFSSRAANALACVADQSPASYMGFVSALWGHFDQGEMKNAELAKMAIDNGAADSVKSCISDGTFRPFVQTATTVAAYDGFTGTPSVMIQDKLIDIANQNFVAEVEAAIKANA